MLGNLIARIVIGGGGSRLWFCLAIAVVLCGCATPVESTEEKPGESEEPMVLDCSPESLGRLGSLDVAIAIDNSLSTQHPTGYDADGDGTVGVIKTAFTDRGDSWLGAQIAAVRPLIKNASAYDVRFSITTLSGQPFFSHRRRSNWAVGDRDARTFAAMTDDVAVLEKALDKIVRAGSDGSANFYAGMRRANQSLIESTDRDQKRRKIVLFISDAPGPLFRTSDGLIRGASARVAAATRDAKRNQIVFNTFGLTEKSPEWSDFSLSLIGSMTGGTYSAVEDPRELYCHLVDSLVIEDAVSSNAETLILAESLSGSSASTTLDLDNLPAGSGLSGLTNDGHVAADWRSHTDGDGATNRGGESSATDNAPAINAAIAFACANGYNTVLIPPGIYRIGGDSSVTGTSWDAIRMDIATCPSGIRLTGHGIDYKNNGTLLLNNQNHGGFMIEISDLMGANDQIGGQQYGIWDKGSTDGSGDPDYVTAIDLGGTTPVITFHAATASTAPAGFNDGDKVFIRECDGSVELNDRAWIFDNGAVNGAEYDFDLLDEGGNDYDPSLISAWIARDNGDGNGGGANVDTSCVITHVNEGTIFELDHFAYGTDSPLADSQFVAAPNIVLTTEEIHGIRGIMSGGRVWIHHTLVTRMGDEAVDFGCNETSLLYEDNICLNSPQGCVIQQGSNGSIVRRNLFDVQSTWINDSETTGTPTEPRNQNGGVLQAGHVQPTCKRNTNMLVENNVVRGQFHGFFGARTASPDFPVVGTSAPCHSNSNITVTHNNVQQQARAGMCDESNEECVSITFRADSGGPFTNVFITDNTFTGPMILRGTLSDNWNVSGNTIIPQIGDPEEVGVTISAKGVHFINNTVRGFERTCLTFADSTLPDIVALVDNSTDWDVATNDELDLGTGHAFVSGDMVQFASGGTLPTGLSAGTSYFIYANSDADNFLFSVLPVEDSSFAQIALSGTPSGSQNIVVSHTTTQIDIIGNTFECIGNASTGAEPMVGTGPVGGGVAFTRPNVISYLNIKDNHIMLDPNGYLDDGINVSYNPKNIIISGNTILAPQPIVGSRAIGIAIKANGALIQNNVIDGYFAVAGIQLVEGANPAPGAEGGARGSLRVIGNSLDMHFAAGGRGIYMYAARAPMIIGNEVMNTHDTGIHAFSGGDANYGGGVISGNRIIRPASRGSSAYGIEMNCSGCGTHGGWVVDGNYIDVGDVYNVDGMFNTGVIDSVFSNNVCDNMEGRNGDCIWLFTGSNNNNCVGNVSHTNGGTRGLFRCGDASSTVGLNCSSAGTGDASICDNNIVSH